MLNTIIECKRYVNSLATTYTYSDEKQPKRVREQTKLIHRHAQRIPEPKSSLIHLVVWENKDLRVQQFCIHKEFLDMSYPKDY